MSNHTKVWLTAKHRQRYNHAKQVVKQCLQRALQHYEQVSLHRSGWKQWLIGWQAGRDQGKYCVQLAKGNEREAATKRGTYEVGR